ALLHARRGTRNRRGFTLVEVLVATTVLVVLVVILFQMTAGVGNIWKSGSGKVSAFQGARSAFSTLSETLSRATLNTYVDYANYTGNQLYFRHADDASNTSDPGNASNFVPKQFARASELHFLCGPTVDIANATQTSGGAALSINATAAANPGDAVFFQAPLNNTLQTATYAGLSRMLNSVGFYLQYEKTDTSLLPTWLAGTASAQKYHYQLVEYVEPTENLQIYLSTSKSKYLLDWLNFAGPVNPTASNSKLRVLAEDVVLLLLRPRLSPTDEKKVADKFGEPYDQATQLGSVLSPNYHYDSRAWQTNYPASARVTDANNSNVAKRVALMTNQLPPIIDLVMVSVDAQSLARFDTTTSTPPGGLPKPSTASLFINSANMEADLTTYAAQLSAAHIRFHIERGAVAIQGAKWSNN
ncbi:MAG: prepilin-type N-terminal cleavage/methylation domain-containing protein, partial [Rhodospirillales bacterium]|nr:prepilin-type N-terminal cleavage/methylation domain-containing protein [Acetobacter sp.]